LEEEGILGDGVIFSQEELGKASNNTNIHIQNFQGILGNVSNSTITQDLDMTIQRGDFEGLAAFLASKGVNEEEISELAEAVKVDLKPVSKNNFGEKVGGWVGKMIGKAASGTWKISVDVGTKLLANAIWAYYGFK
jgi:hypothetical protein